MNEAPTIEDVLEHTRLVVSFGGISMKNTQINQGGIGDHSARGHLQRWRDAGVEVVCISPVRDDVADFLDADWWPIRPNADVALMLGLAHTLHSEDLHDKDFLRSHCVGYERFVPYLLGESDGVPKDADWAAAICDIEADRIRALARRMASEPCLLSISWSLQRTENGDQPYWMIAVLGAMLGNLGLPGQGVGYGYGCIHNFGFAGRRSLPFKVGALPQGDNPVSTFIPVARIADMLLDPGGTVPFNGQTLTYPDIRLIYWAGGNPFHHHQDLNRLRRAFAKPETIIVNEPFWTATARHADIVFPATTALEREDFAWGTSELYAAPMHQALEPFEESRDDYAILTGLAERLGFAERFTEGRTPREWIEHLWKVTVQRAAEAEIDLPDFQTFWQGGVFRLDPEKVPARTFTLERFRADPEGAPLRDAVRQGRDLLGKDRVLRSRRLQGASDVVRQGGVHRQCPLGTLSAGAQLQPARDPAAQPVRLRQDQPRRQDRRPRGDPHPPARRRGQRHRRWRHRPRVQRPRRDARGRRGHGPGSTGRRRAADRRLV